MKRSQRALVLLLGSLLGCEPVRGPPPGGGQVSASPAQKKPSITATATTPPQVSSAPEPIRESPQALISPDDPLPPKVVRRLGTSRLWTNGYVYGLAFSDDSSVVTSINYLGVVERWKAATGELIDRFTPKNARFGQRFALSPNGSVVAMGERDAKDRFLISLWGIAEKSLKTQRKLGEARGIEQIALAADGRVAAANDDGLVRYFAAGATLPTGFPPGPPEAAR